ncbi:hypothetical protein ABC766_30255 [Methylobacterium fujisawaense]|uniref:hypothetical protein n=1 Tax=Methylobacterium fujisawaense TaxID=107400 RepID=UPI0031F5D38E
MDEAIRAKLVEILKRAYVDGAAAVYDACLAAQDELAEGEKRVVADGMRCLRAEDVTVRVTPFAFHASGRNHVVRFHFELSGSAGNAFGSVDCEAALKSMTRWPVTAAALVPLMDVTGGLREAILAVDAAALERADCP